MVGDRRRDAQPQPIAQSRQLELQIATEVTNAALLVDSNRERMQAATAAKDLADLRLGAEQSRFEVGLSTNFFVVQAQRDLRDAQNAELRALLDYRRAQVEFERVQEIPSAGTVGITNIQPGNATAPQSNTYKGSCKILVNPWASEWSTNWWLLDTGGVVKPFADYELTAPLFTYLTSPQDPNVFMAAQFLYGAEERRAASETVWWLSMACTSLSTYDPADD